MKARNSLVFYVKRRKKAADGENVVFKALDKFFFLTSKSCSWPTFYQMDFIKGQWYVILLCCITKSRLDVQFVKTISLGNGHWPTDEKRGVWSKLTMVFTFNVPFICYLSRICK